MPVQIRPNPSRRYASRMVRATTQRRPATGQTGWIWPTVSRRITQQPSAGHLAFDIGASQQGRVGEPVWAPAAGRVTAIRNEPSGYGINVRLGTLSGEEVILGHLQGVAPGLQPGDLLQPGELVGLLGSTGRSSGPHLHYEIRAPGPDTFASGASSTRSALDPRTYYPAGYGGRPAFTELPPISGFQFLTSPEAPRPGQVASIGQTPVSSAQPAQGYPTVPSSGRVGVFAPSTQSTNQGEEIRIASTPLGDVTIPKPPVRKWIAFGFGAVLVVISVTTLLGRGVQSGQKKLAGMALDIAPGTGEIRTLGKALRLVK